MVDWNGDGQGLVDTHCHIDFQDFEADRLAVMERAGAAGVVRLLNPGTDIATSLDVLRIAMDYPWVYAAIGVHPSSATTWTDDSREKLLSLSVHPKVVAIGEIGLDYYRDHAPRPLQRRIMAVQLELAAELGLPVVVHNRDASEDVLNLLVDWQSGLRTAKSPLAERPGVLHSFSGDQALAERILQHGFFLGVSGPVTFRNASELQDFIKWAPLDRLLLETDSPFLAPHPFRGRRNEPAYVRFVAEKISELRDMPYEEIAAITTHNAMSLFGWRDVD